MLQNGITQSRHYNNVNVMHAIVWFEVFDELL